MSITLMNQALRVFAQLRNDVLDAINVLLQLTLLDVTNHLKINAINGLNK